MMSKSQKGLPRTLHGQETAPSSITAETLSQPEKKTVKIVSLYITEQGQPRLFTMFPFL